MGERFYHIAGPLAVGIIGYIIAMSTMNIAARYVSLYVDQHASNKIGFNDNHFSSFLMALTFSGYVVIMTWVSKFLCRELFESETLSVCIFSTNHIGAFESQ